MFDFSFAELLVVLLIASLLFKKEDVAFVLRKLQTMSSKCKNWYDKLLRYLEGDPKKGEVIDYIIDLDGKVQGRYNFDEIRPDIIEKPKRKRSKKNAKKNDNK